MLCVKACRIFSPNKMRSTVPNLTALLHKGVVVRTTNGCTFEGILVGYDAFMNVVLNSITQPEGFDSTAIIRGECVKNIVPTEDGL